MLVVDIVRCNNSGRYFLTNSDANVHSTNNQVPEHGMGHDNTLVHWFRSSISPPLEHPYSHLHINLNTQERWKKIKLTFDICLYYVWGNLYAHWCRAKRESMTMQARAICDDFMVRLSQRTLSWFLLSYDWVIVICQYNVYIH